VSKWSGALLVSEWAGCEARTGMVGLHLNGLNEKNARNFAFLLLGIDIEKKFMADGL
jgi:hypothetical protein